MVPITAVTDIAASTSPTASRLIGIRLRRNECSGNAYAATVSSGGRKANNTRSGGMRTAGRSGNQCQAKPATKPLMAKITGDGVRNRRASRVVATTSARMTNAASMRVMTSRLRVAAHGREISLIALSAYWRSHLERQGRFLR